MPLTNTCTVCNSSFTCVPVVLAVASRRGHNCPPTFHSLPVNMLILSLPFDFTNYRLEFQNKHRSWVKPTTYFYSFIGRTHCWWANAKQASVHMLRMGQDQQIAVCTPTMQWYLTLVQLISKLTLESTSVMLQRVHYHKIYFKPIACTDRLESFMNDTRSAECTYIQTMVRVRTRCKGDGSPPRKWMLSGRQHE